MYIIRSILLSTLLLTISATSWAAIISISGDIALISAPTSVVSGQFEDSTTTSAFDEQQAYVLTSSLSVDQLATTATSGVIANGTRINSYFVHMDLVGDAYTPEDVLTFTGTLTFDTRVLGLIWTGEPCTAEGCPPSVMNLDSSDYLGAPSTTYSTGELGRGFEADDYYAFNGSQDFVSLSSDGYSVSFTASSHPLRSDQLRIITASPVPVPLSIWLFSSGVLALVGFTNKRKKTN